MGVATNMGKVVVVTGTSTGFGRLIAETLARKNYQVFATMRNVNGKNAGPAQELRELAKRESLALHVVELGVTEAVTLEQARRIMDTNFFGAVRMNRAVLPYMRRQKGGLLIHISSGAGRVVVPSMGFYCASKWAMEALAEEYRYELARLGIDSVIIQPGAYPTAVFNNIERAADTTREEAYGAVNGIADRVLGMLGGAKGDPQEIADVVLRTIKAPPDQRKLRQRVGTGVQGIVDLNQLSETV